MTHAIRCQIMDTMTGEVDTKDVNVRELSLDAIGEAIAQPLEILRGVHFRMTEPNRRSGAAIFDAGDYTVVVIFWLDFV